VTNWGPGPRRALTFTPPLDASGLVAASLEGRGERPLRLCRPVHPRRNEPTPASYHGRGSKESRRSAPFDCGRRGASCCRTQSEAFAQGAIPQTPITGSRPERSPGKCVRARAELKGLDQSEPPVHARQTAGAVALRAVGLGARPPSGARCGHAQITGSRPERSPGTCVRARAKLKGMDETDAQTTAIACGRSGAPPSSGAQGALRPAELPPAGRDSPEPG
jgi:hypothetical protein